MGRLSDPHAGAGKRGRLATLTTLAIGALQATCACAQHDSAQLRNWFDDPFFQLSAQVAGCAEPRGPRLTRPEMEREAHARTERGTRCYLEGKCTKANAYQYDAGIADELRRRLTGAPVLHGTTVWVTVERRWVWLQGCVSSAAQARKLQAAARGVPDVERVFVELGSRDKPPYATLTATPH